MPSSPIPTSVLILGKTYRVATAPDTHPDAGNENTDTQVITIASGQHPEAERDTMLHEVVHAISNQIGLGLVEKQVRALGCGLYQVLTQNPDLVGYVRGF